MEKFSKVTGVAAPLPMVNIDTDKIIPKQYLKTIGRSGLSKGLFHELRTDAEGRNTGEFVLDRPPYTRAKILVVGDNFGCGSSREHAPWALQDFGIKAVIGTSYADIFFNNSFKNGMLLVKLKPAQVATLMEVARDAGNPEITVDLEQQKVFAPNGVEFGFDIDPFLKRCLLEGLDDIGLTLQKDGEISTFEKEQSTRQPWLYRDAS
jgi:3-isopropylmalate/(R)-2-methylmalate dehydratase small subunit